MADDVVDIRRRITEMRNEVSAAIVSNRDAVIESRSVGNRANISFSQPNSENNKEVRQSEVATSQPNELTPTTTSGSISDDMAATFKGLDAAAKMPAFQLNVRNQVSTRLVMAMIGIQVITNILLVTILWAKLG
tara:strand:+ start:83 stop:484 length:402 start_codon:yes stop_codon:yes gene_type:complete